MREGLLIRSGEEILAKMGRQVTPSFLSPKFMQSMPILKEERGSDDLAIPIATN